MSNCEIQISVNYGYRMFAKDITYLITLLYQRRHLLQSLCMPLELAAAAHLDAVQAMKALAWTM